MVERQPSKLRVAGSNPVSRSIEDSNKWRVMSKVEKLNSLLVTDYQLLVLGAHVAQLAEHILGKDEVTGSIPVMGSRAERLKIERV